MAEGSFDTLLRAFVHDVVEKRAGELERFFAEDTANGRITDELAAEKIDKLAESIAALTTVARQNSTDIAALTAAVAKNTTEMKGLKAVVSSNNEAIRESLQGAANAVPRVATQATASTTDRLVARKLCM